MHVAGQYGALVLLEVVLPEAINDGGHGDHVTFPHLMVKRLIKASMRSLALSLVSLVRCVYLEVVKMD
jgi:hypothetical protein